jgi:hypothetical protein
MTEFKTKFDSDWETLFDRHGIFEGLKRNGLFRISASEINRVHEARLMAKFDKSANLPKIFRENNLSILPVSRGEYLIGPFATHLPVRYLAQAPIKVDGPDLETLKPDNLYSEASAIFFAYNSGIIQDVLGGGKVSLTVNGRMSSGEFSFSINHRTDPQKSFPVEVKKSQIEIDTGFESPDAFLICEAKNQATEEMLIRRFF